MKKLIPVSTGHRQYSVLILQDGFPQTHDAAVLLCCNGDRPATENVRGERFHWVFNKKEPASVVTHH